MERNDVLDAILALATSCEPEALGELTISLAQEPLYEAALEHFGGWDIALAAAVQQALAKKPQREKPRGSAEALEDEGERSPHVDALRPLICGTREGFLIRVSAEQIAQAAHLGKAQPPETWPDRVGDPLWFSDGLGADAVASVADDGRVFGWDARIVPDASGGIVERRLADRDAVTGWTCIHPRDLYHKEGSFVHVTRNGKVKVSLTTTFKRLVSREGVQAFLLDEGDEPIAAYLCQKGDFALIASSNGYAIQFPVAEIRPMGLKATGVKGMKLDFGVTAVGSLLGSRCEQVAFVTKHGVGKRVPVHEFRPQSRAGAGLVAIRLAARDKLAAIAPCSFNSDLLITTTLGNILRAPAGLFPLMGRPAKGNRVIDLRDGEEVRALTSLLPAAYA